MLPAMLGYLLTLINSTDDIVPQVTQPSIEGHIEGVEVADGQLNANTDVQAITVEPTASDANPTAPNAAPTANAAPIAPNAATAAPDAATTATAAPTPPNTPTAAPNAVVSEILRWKRRNLFPSIQPQFLQYEAAIRSLFGQHKLVQLVPLGKGRYTVSLLRFYDPTHVYAVYNDQLFRTDLRQVALFRHACVFSWGSNIETGNFLPKGEVSSEPLPESRRYVALYDMR